MVIAIIGVLIALLLPAVQAAREAAGGSVHEQPEAARPGPAQLREHQRHDPPPTILVGWTGSAFAYESSWSVTARMAPTWSKARSTTP